MQPLSIEHVERLLSAAIARDDDAETARLSTQLDELDARSRRSADVALVSAALWYAEQGLHVFPLKPGSKEPWPRSHGCKDATTDVAQIRDWWTRSPSSNIGLATGHVVNVIDIDGLRGNVELAHIFDDITDDEHERDQLFKLMMSDVIGQVLTPRAGGRHLYLPTGGRDYGNGAALAPCVDYRGRGGYVVAPPSITSVGAYRWVAPLHMQREREQ